MFLLPYTIMTVYNFQEIEKLMRDRISEQDRESLATMLQSLESMMGIAVKTATLLEQDPVVSGILASPGQYDALERKRLIESKFQSISNSFFLSGTQVYYTLIDFEGHVYTSFLPEDQLDYGRLLETLAPRGSAAGDRKYTWKSSDSNYVSRDISRSPYVITLNTAFQDEDLKPVGIARISIDYMQWFRAETAGPDNGQNYFIVDRAGQVIQQSNPGASFPAEAAALLDDTAEPGPLLIRGRSESMYNYGYLSELQWYVVKEVPLDRLYGEVDRQRGKYFMTLLLLSAAFMGMTYWITTAITSPLKKLQKKMENISDADLGRTVLPDRRGAEEIAALSRSFNRMMADMNKLIGRLRLEERQRQAVRFQVLLSQMDPHFLLNTLNTIKCIALSKDDEETHDICVSLGKLLEVSLDLEVDMIFLKDEIELVQAYIFIQNIRYGHKFAIEYEFEDAFRYALVPKATLQPLVENAIYHGFAARQEGLIKVRAYRRSECLVLEVEDNGSGLAPRPKAYRKRKGIGIQNIRERLELLFGRQASLELLGMEQGAMARITIPLLLSTPYAEGGNEHGMVGDRRGG